MKSPAVLIKNLRSTISCTGISRLAEIPWEIFRSALEHSYIPVKIVRPGQLLESAIKTKKNISEHGELEGRTK